MLGWGEFAHDVGGTGSRGEGEGIEVDVGKVELVRGARDGVERRRGGEGGVRCSGRGKEDGVPKEEVVEFGVAEELYEMLYELGSVLLGDWGQGEERFNRERGFTGECPELGA